MYSHEMIREIEDESGEVFRLNQGTLYPMLHALESEGPRTASVPGTEADGGSRRPGGAADAANRPRLEWGPLLLAGSLLGVGLFTLHTVESHGSATGGSSRPSLPRRQDKFDSESLYPRCPGRTLHRPPMGPARAIVPRRLPHLLSHVARRPLLDQLQDLLHRRPAEFAPLVSLSQLGRQVSGGLTLLLQILD